MPLKFQCKTRCNWGLSCLSRNHAQVEMEIKSDHLRHDDMGEEFDWRSNALASGLDGELEVEVLTV
jgi:hypothetical protein